MLWICIYFIVLAIMAGLKNISEEDIARAQTSEQIKQARKVDKVMEGIICTLGGLGVLAAVGTVWYYICFGALLFSADSFWEGVFYFLVSVFLLGIVGGLVAIFFGWNPKN